MPNEIVSHAFSKSPWLIAAEYFPGFDESSLDHAVWGWTGYPVFFSGDKPREQQFREQLKFAAENEPCESCDQLGAIYDGEEETWRTCPGCHGKCFIGTLELRESEENPYVAEVAK